METIFFFFEKKKTCGLPVNHADPQRPDWSNNAMIDFDKRSFPPLLAIHVRETPTEEGFRDFLLEFQQYIAKGTGVPGQKIKVFVSVASQVEISIVQIRLLCHALDQIEESVRTNLACSAVLLLEDGNNGPGVGKQALQAMISICLKIRPMIAPFQVCLSREEVSGFLAKH